MKDIDRIYIIDDTANATELGKFITDMSWVNHPEDNFARLGMPLDDLMEAIARIPQGIRTEIASNSRLFADRVHAVVIKTVDDITRVLKLMEEECSAIAFVDFDYRHSPGDCLPALDAMYDDLDASWQMHETGQDKGGFVFSSHFRPGNDPLRLLCPSTAMDIERLIAAHDNLPITTNCSLHRGKPSFINAIITAFQMWEQRSNLCPLDVIWSLAEKKKWFSDKTNSDRPISVNNMLHTLAYTQDEWCPTGEDGWDGSPASKHYDIVSDVLKLELPRRWWFSLDSAMNIVESLKGLCGTHYCGTPVEERKYNLKIGSIFLIALMAFRDANRGASYAKIIEGIPDFTKLDKIRNSFWKRQNKGNAKAGARACYFFLKSLLQIDAKHTADGDSIHLNSIVFADRGRSMSLNFNKWNAESMQESIADMVGDINDLDALVNLLRSYQVESKWELQLVMLWLNGMLNMGGLGCPGTMWMDGKVLYISSMEA